MMMMPIDRDGSVRRRIAVGLLLAGAGLALAGCAGHGTGPTSLGAASDEVMTFRVEGMACRNCAVEVANELRAVPGVRDAVIDFDTATATVAIDPARRPSPESLQAAVKHWRIEHFSLEEDPDCLDPDRRKALRSPSG